MAYFDIYFGSRLEHQDAMLGYRWRGALAIASPVLKSHQAEKNQVIPMSQQRYRKVTSGSGKSHQGRRITMAQPVSSVMIHMHKSCRSSAHSRENDRYFAEKVHICWESSWNGWKTAGTRIITSDWNPTGKRPFGTYTDMIFEGKYHGTACFICNWRFS